MNEAMNSQIEIAVQPQCLGFEERISEYENGFS